MHDFFCTDPDDMNYQQLAKKVRYFKREEQGVATMCKVLEDMRNEVAREAIERNSIETALRMIADGMPVELVAKYAMLPIEKVQELAKQKTA